MRTTALFNHLWAPRSNPGMHLASHLLPASTVETLPPASALWPIIMFGGGDGGACMRMSVCVCAPQGLWSPLLKVESMGICSRWAVVSIYCTQTLKESSAIFYSVFSSPSQHNPCFIILFYTSYFSQSENIQPPHSAWATTQKCQILLIQQFGK